MDPTTIAIWLWTLTGVVACLTVLTALDLSRAWHRTASATARQLVRNAVQEAELEHVTGAHRVEPASPLPGAAGASTSPTPDPEIAAAIATAFRREMAEPTTGPLEELHMPSPSDLLAPPPMVGGDTLRDWLIHYRQTPEAWMDVVQEFYDRAAQDEEIADYFVGVDWPELKRHFMAALVLVTHSGVTRALPATMAARHAGVRNSAGDPITPAIFDRTIGILAGVLADYDVPAATLDQLGPVIAPFRMAIARERVNRTPNPTEVRPGDAAARATWPEWREQRGGSVTEEGDGRG
jgi:hemoglobin